jgi:D-aspartate ligase
VICKLAEECGCNIPKQEVVDTGILPSSLCYPVMTKTLKSTMGLWKEDSYICNNEDELKVAYSKIQSPKLLIEEYLNKQNEFSLQGYSCNFGQEVYIPYKITYLRSSSSSYGHYMKVETFNDESLFLQIKRIIEAARYEGCFEVEFLIDQENRIWFLEVNFRFSFWNYALTFGGVNYPIKWAESMLMNHIVSPPKESIKPYFTALNEPGDYGQSVVGKKISLFQWLKDIHTADMLYFYNPKDTLPAWSFWWHKITRIITKKISRKR